jgi:hypothetical protein
VSASRGLAVNADAARGTGLGVFSGEALLGELDSFARCGDEKPLRTGLVCPKLDGAAGTGEWQSCCAVTPTYLDAREPGATALGRGAVAFRVGATGVFMSEGSWFVLWLDMPGVMRPEDIAGVMRPDDDTLDALGVMRPYELGGIDGVTRLVL